MNYQILIIAFLTPNLICAMKESSLPAASTKQTPEQKKSADKYNKRGKKVEEVPLIGPIIATQLYKKASKKNSPTADYYLSSQTSDPDVKIQHYKEALTKDFETIHTSHIVTAYNAMKYCNNLVEQCKKRGDSTNASKYKNEELYFSQKRDEITNKLRSIEKPLSYGSTTQDSKK